MERKRRYDFIDGAKTNETDHRQNKLQRQFIKQKLFIEALSKANT